MAERLIKPCCRVCGCTDENCEQCIAKTGAPCTWIEDDLCSACAGEPITLGDVVGAANLLGALAENLAPHARVPAGREGATIAAVGQYFQELANVIESMSAPALQRAVAVAAQLAASTSTYVALGLQRLAAIDAGEVEAPPRSEAPRILGPDGMTPAAAAPTLVDAAGRPLALGGG